MHVCTPGCATTCLLGRSASGCNHTHGLHAGASRPPPPPAPCPRSRSDEEEGGGAGASEDEEEGLDDQGELVRRWELCWRLWWRGWWGGASWRRWRGGACGGHCASALASARWPWCTARRSDDPPATTCPCPRSLPNPPLPTTYPSHPTPPNNPPRQAGLIGEARETARDGALRAELHRRWAQAQDDKEVQALMAGLKSGFRRRRGAGFLDDDVRWGQQGQRHGGRAAAAAAVCQSRAPGSACLPACLPTDHSHLPRGAHPPCAAQDDELAGRRRRARADGSDDEGGPGGDAELGWPSPGSDDEAEDEELLRRARQGQLLAEGAEADLDDGLPGGAGAGGSGGLGGSGGIPLDEGSQEVLGLLARCGSEPLLAGGAGGGSGPLPRAGSRLGPLASLGSDPSNSRLPPGGGLSRGPSFVGRQPTVQRGASSSALGVAGGRSFVFGRGEDSSSALPPVRCRRACQWAGGASWCSQLRRLCA